MIIFLVYLAVFVLFPKFLAVNDCSILMHEMIRVHEIMIRVLNMATCANVFILFHGRNSMGAVLELMKKDHFKNIFISFGLFPQAFWQVNEWPILKLNEMIRVPHAVTYPVTSISFENRDWLGGVLKLMKSDHFQSLWPFGSFSPSFWTG